MADGPPSPCSQKVISSISHDSTSLRNTLLIASMHYSWNSGNLNSYLSTHLFHKLTSLQEINRWIGDANVKQNAVKIIQSIATHCMVEMGLGNVATAQTHLKGLMDFVDPMAKYLCKPGNVDEVLTNRYILLVLVFVIGHAIRYPEETQHVSHRTKSLSDCGSDMMYSLIRQGHCEDSNGLDNRLRAILLLPYFFKPPLLVGGFQLIDASGALQHLFKVTKHVDMMADAGNAEAADPWTPGAAFFLMLFDLHVYSTSPSRGDGSKEPPSPELACAWSPLVGAFLLYFSSCLRLYDVDVFWGCKIRRYLLYLVREDILENKAALKHWGQKNRMLWLWKVFNVAISLDKSPPKEETDLPKLGKELADCLRYWSQITGITEWIEVKTALKVLAWPDNYSIHTRAKAIWNSAV